jgi:phosphotransacetylase
VHILTPSSTVRRLVNMTALAVAAPSPRTERRDPNRWR